VARMLGKELGEVQRAGQTAFRRHAMGAVPSVAISSEVISSGSVSNSSVSNSSVSSDGISSDATSSQSVLNSNRSRARSSSAPASSASEPAMVLSAHGLRRGTRLRDASLHVGRGEIVGLAGLLGSGRTETARAIFGADPLEGGELHLSGVRARLHGPADAIRAGLGFCSEDRKVEGIIPDLSVRENLTLALMPALSKSGIVDRARQTAVVTEFIAKLGIKTSSPEQPIRA
jgi:ABC-type sugar transport system ATPase subunit